jgi:hypothetical protein
VTFDVIQMMGVMSRQGRVMMIGNDDNGRRSSN